MTITDPEVDRRRTAKAHEMARGLRELAAFIETAENIDLPWRIYASVSAPWLDDDQTDEQKRGVLRRWLGWHFRALHRFGAHPTKSSNSYAYQVSAGFPTESDNHPVVFQATASGETVCEMRPVLDEAGQPVMETVDVETVTERVITTETRPKMEKHCPPSLLDGLDELPS